MTINMKTNQQTCGDSRVAPSAFTITEVLVAVIIVSIVFVSLYTAFSCGFASIKLAREDLRATQIMLKRMESVRLYTWSQIQDPDYFPTNTFSEYYDPAGQTNGSGGGIPYTVTVSRTPNPSFTPSAAYSPNLRLITVRVSWASGNVRRQREMCTYVTRYGIQNYVYDK